MPKKSTSTPSRYWLFKSEPHVFSIDDLASAKKQITNWSGVRNYQARNMMRDEMQVGDTVLFYHSSTNPTAIVGVARVVRAAYPDPTSWDETSPYHDPKSSPDAPRWFMVDIQFVEKFARPLTLEYLRSVESLKNMVLLRKGSRLSIQPVTPAEFATIEKLARQAN